MLLYKLRKQGGWHVKKPENPFHLQAGSQGHILLKHEIVAACLQTGLDAESYNQASRCFSVHALISACPILYPASIL